jgi:hypothetical protein
MRLYHQTSIAEAVAVLQRGFQDQRWSFPIRDRDGEDIRRTGVWLTDRPLSQGEGPGGDAQLEVEISLADDSLVPFALDGIFWEVRLYVVPAEIVNAHGKARILEVDPGTSWTHETRRRDE